MDRVSYKKLVEWLNTDSLFSNGNFYLSAYDGYYHIRSNEEEGSKCIICEKTPGRTWESWNIYKAGYYYGKNGKIY